MNSTSPTVTTFQGSLSSCPDVGYTSGNKYFLWQAASSVKRNIIIIFLVLSLVFAIIFVTIGFFIGMKVFYMTSETGNLATEYCLTPACMKTASTMLDSMNTSVDPCIDFYQYACGGWIQKNPLPEGLSRLDIMTKLQLDNYAILKSPLEDSNFDLKSEAEMKARTYYYSCMDKNGTVEELGSEPILELINKIGGWNISGEFNINEWSFQKTLEHLLLYNPTGLFSFTLNEHDIFFEKPKLVLGHKDYYVNKSADDKILGGYLEYMTKVGILLGGEEISTREQMKNVLEFEIKLANMCDSYKYTNFTELNSLVPYIDWLQYLNFAFEMVNIKINDSQKMRVDTNLLSIVTEYWSKPESRIVLSNYLIWSMVHTMVPYLSEPFRKASKPLLKPMKGIEDYRSKWITCVSSTSRAVGFALGAMFIRKTFREESKSELAQIFSEVRNAFVANTYALSWIDEETAKAVKNKAEAIRIEPIGYPSYILNPEELNQKYEGLDFSPDLYFHNNIRVKKFQLLEKLRQLGKLQDHTIWTWSPMMVNANYHTIANHIQLFAGILRPPYYDPSHPKFLNYGGIGTVMGHEITHGFDYRTNVFSRKENQTQWWKNETFMDYGNKSQCFEDQYSKFEVNGENVKGKETRRDNIADNGGLNASFRAYLNWTHQHKTEPALPAINLTNTQLFFVVFAQLWCGTSTKESEHFHIISDPHSPVKYRVLGTLSNSNDFSREFNCLPGSPMNPKDKCQLW